MLHPKEAESASFDCFLTKNRLTEEAESASFDSPARIGLMYVRSKCQNVIEDSRPI